MIIEAILAVFKFIIVGIINLLPTIPQIDINSLDGVFMVLSTIDLVINVKAFAGCLVALFLVLNIQLIYGVIMWVVRKIPTVE